MAASDYAPTSIYRLRLQRRPQMTFGSAALMQEALGVSPGSVTVFALLNDTGRRVRLVLDQALTQSDPVNFHPLRNDATTTVSRDGLQRLLAALDRRPILVDFASLA